MTGRIYLSQSLPAWTRMAKTRSKHTTPCHAIAPTWGSDPGLGHGLRRPPPFSYPQATPCGANIR